MHDYRAADLELRDVLILLGALVLIGTGVIGMFWLVAWLVLRFRG